MDSEDIDSPSTSSSKLLSGLTYPVILPGVIALAVGVASHSLVFIELTGAGPNGLGAIPLDPGSIHFAWLCGGCGLALMFAAFAMLR